ncbi:MAG: Rid family detoxifying hydrolase [Candidatus Cloacimonetes bacterium]|nr:Rid family detoxifying hydrolase [Candidatus Cloacimonadota bacterium]
MRVIHSEKAPAALGCYSQAVERQGMLWTSMQIGIVADSGELAENFAGQMQQIMENLGAILEAGGYEWGKVVKVSIYLADLADFSEMNGIYTKYLHLPYPAREVVEVRSLPRGARAGVSLIAMK